MTRIYDGSLVCSKCEHCPVVDFDSATGQVVVHDPHNPGNGAFKMTKEEYNLLLANARPIK